MNARDFVAWIDTWDDVVEVNDKNSLDENFSSWIQIINEVIFVYQRILK